MELFRRKTLIAHVVETYGLYIVSDNGEEAYLVGFSPLEKELIKYNGYVAVLNRVEELPVPRDDLPEGVYIYHLRYSRNYLNDVYLRHEVAHGFS